jgi:hypothetical protein
MYHVSFIKGMSDWKPPNYWTQNGVIATTCPLEILYKVFSYLPTQDICHTSQVCQLWHLIGQTDPVWTSHVNEEILTGLQHCSLIQGQIRKIKSHFYGSNEIQRLEFLEGTVQLWIQCLQDHYASRLWETWPNHKYNTQVLTHVNRQFAQTLDVLKRLTRPSTPDLVEDGRCYIQIEYDSYELALKRYYEELVIMMPNKQYPNKTPYQDYLIPVKDCRLDMIADPLARTFWFKQIGAGISCHFSTFSQKLIGALPQPHDLTRFLIHLSHFLNFPRDNLMSVYRLHTLVCLFGPWNHITDNFETYAMNRGFLGYTNMIKAEEIYRTLIPQHNTVMIRFSRQKPTYLAFTSYNHMTRSIEHRRNSDRLGRSIPIATFLKEQYPGYVLADVQVDDSVANAVFIYHIESHYLTVRAYGGT